MFVLIPCHLYQRLFWTGLALFNPHHVLRASHSQLATRSSFLEDIKTIWRSITSTLNLTISRQHDFLVPRLIFFPPAPPKFNISETGICVPINYILDSMKYGILVTSFFFMLSFFLKGRQKEPSLKSKQQTNARLFTRALVSWDSRFLTPLFQFAFWIAQALYIPSFTIRNHASRKCIEKRDRSEVKLWRFI